MSRNYLQRMPTMCQDEAVTTGEFTDLWPQAAPRVRAYVMMSIASYHDAEDVVQEVALALSNSMHNYDRGRPFLEWALGFARMRVLRHLKSKGKHRRLIYSSDNLDDIEAAFVEVKKPSEEPEEQIRLCVERLSSRSRRLFELRYTHSMSASEIAEATSMTVESVYARLSQIRSSLRDCVARRLEAEKNL